MCVETHTELGSGKEITHTLMRYTIDIIEHICIIILFIYLKWNFFLFTFSILKYTILFMYCIVILVIAHFHWTKN